MRIAGPLQVPVLRAQGGAQRDIVRVRGTATGARAAAWLKPGGSGDAPDPQAVTPAASNAGAKNTARMRSSR